MLEHLQNGPIMPSSESKVVQNDEFLSKLEQKLIKLSSKYGLGEILFREKKKMLNQEPYNAALDYPLFAEKLACKKLCHKFNQLSPEKMNERIRLLSKI